jgi:hypothetical protein
MKTKSELQDPRHKILASADDRVERPGNAVTMRQKTK